MLPSVLFCSREARQMFFAADVPGPPCSGNFLLRVVAAGHRHLLVLDVVPGLELLLRELVRLRDRESHHFLDHRVSQEGSPDWSMGGNVGIQNHLHLGGHFPDARSQNKQQIQQPVLSFFSGTH
eukprot:15190432-Heterocapsa_arctica.AAC.1